jgi:hypothetical protein
MSNWFVSGPVDVPMIQKGAARFIDETSIDELCEGCAELERPAGVYVFGLRTGGGIVPVYIGMTEGRSLRREAFNDRNVKQIDRYINEHKGTLVIYVVTQIKGPGKPNISDISEIEYFLIGRGKGRNPNLINVRTPAEDAFSIKGVYNGGPGKSTNGEASFKEMMGL